MSAPAPKSLAAKARATFLSYLRSRIPVVAIRSNEEGRVLRELAQVAASREFKLVAWSIRRGYFEPGLQPKELRDIKDPLAAIEAAAEWPERAVLVFCDPDRYLEQDPVAQRALREVADLIKRLPPARAKTIVLLSAAAKLPAPMEAEGFVMEWPLPEREELAATLDAILKAQNLTLDPAQHEAAVSAALGLSTVEASASWCRSIVDAGTVEPEVVAEQKRQAVAKSGILEFIETEGSSLNDVGGLDLLKSWLAERREAFSDEAREYGLPAPKGALTVGPPGCGKSLTARALAAAWKIPLLRLDLGRVFAGIVGASEANLRSALRTAEAVAPCILWLDEIEKGISAGGGETDGGVSARVLGQILTWMQEQRGGVFVYATANDVSKLPPELLRKGRFDELFALDLPTQEERAEIFAAVIRRSKGRDPARFDLGALAAATAGFCGAEVEAAWNAALYRAFPERREPTAADILAAAGTIVPLEKTASEKIEALRRWARERARPASSRSSIAHDHGAPQLV